MTTKLTAEMTTVERTTEKAVKVGRSTVTLAFLIVLNTVLVCMNASAEVGEITDQEITNSIYSELLLDEAVPSHLIDIETEEGRVQLSGSVESLLARRGAVELASYVRVVKHVESDIEVDPPDRSDVEIRSDVVTAMADDPAVELRL